MERLPQPWSGTSDLSPRALTCGHCGHFMSSSVGYKLYEQGTLSRKAYIYICSHCRGPNFLLLDGGHLALQEPGSAFGTAVESVPPNVGALYDEARNCMKVSAYTSAVLACRKLLMNIAVTEGADEGKRFIEYVEYLAEQGYVPPGGKHWVDHIRQQGNEATHEIETKSESDAKDLISFVEMLLKFIYEFPARVPSAVADAESG